MRSGLVTLSLVVGAAVNVGREEKEAVDCLLDKIIPALIQVESGGDDGAVGDKNRKHKAYGCLQIRQPYLDDVNKLWGTKYSAEEMLGNRRLSVKVARAYLKRYATQKRLGRAPTLEDLARIHNGGPNGWKRAETKKYWRKVEKVLTNQTQI